MKNIYKGLLGIMLAILAVACQPEYDPGETAAVGYSGEWYYQIYNADTLFQDYDYHGDVFLTYGTTNDLGDEIWIDDQDNAPLYMKAKFSVTGTPTSFAGTGISPNEIAIDYYGQPAFPDSGNVQIIDTMDYDYAVIELIGGEIIEDGAIVAADREESIADSIRIEVVGHAAVFHYTTREVMYHEVDTTTTPKIDTTYAIYVLERDEDFFEVLYPLDTFVYAGHRQTGWEVYY